MPPSLLGRAVRTPEEQLVEERIRTLSQVPLLKTHLALKPPLWSKSFDPGPRPNTVTQYCYPSPAITAQKYCRGLPSPPAACMFEQNRLMHRRFCTGDCRRDVRGYCSLFSAIHPHPTCARHRTQVYPDAADRPTITASAHMLRQYLLPPPPLLRER